MMTENPIIDIVDVLLISSPHGASDEAYDDDDNRKASPLSKTPCCSCSCVWFLRSFLPSFLPLLDGLLSITARLGAAAAGHTNAR